MKQTSTKMMIFIPLSRQDAETARQDGARDGDLGAFAATAQLMAAHDYRSDEREDADYAAQLYASLAGLAAFEDDRRLVLAADVPIARVHDATDELDYGAIRVGGLTWSDVTAVFVDEPEAVEAVQSARKAIRDLATATSRPRLEQILQLAEVTALTEAHELLWHTPDEQW
jgi:hypothetical protein